MRIPPVRFTISGAMGAILAFAVGLAALRNANELWAGVMSLLTWAFLGLALLGVIHERRDARARWLGFLVFAGGYSVLAFAPWFSEHVGSTLVTTQLLGYVHTQIISSPVPRSTTIQPLLDQRSRLTSKLNWAERTVRNSNDPALVIIQSRIATLDGQIAAIQGYSLPTGAPGAGGQSPSQPNRWQALVPGAANYDQFLCVGHCLSALLAGVVGAVISSRLYSRRERQPDLQAGTPEP